MPAPRITGVFLLAFVQYGLCSTLQRRSCNQVCPFFYLPVCGSDGNTYSNTCYLEIKNCESPNLLITKKHDNACPQPDMAASKRGAADECSFDCPDEYSPVCGSNWHTFNNECELKKANCTSDYNIRQVSRGVCKIFPGKRSDVATTTPVSNDPCEYGCNPNYRPICASDGKTYDNYCALTIENCHKHQSLHIHPVSGGPCVSGKRASEMSCPEECPMVWKPVCGSDGITYSNDCALDINICHTKGLVFKVADKACVPTASGTSLGDLNLGDLAVSKRTRDCNKPIICIAINDPVCGSDGHTYSNECTMNAPCKPGLVLAHKGTCNAGGIKLSNLNLGDLAVSKRARDCDKPIVCLALYYPVCGSDGKTYSNPCTMDTECTGTAMAYTGVCTSASSAASKRAGDTCPLFCTEQYQPVCGSDGRTYSNGCFLNIAHCHNGQVTMVSKGECGNAGGIKLGDLGDLAVSKRARDCDKPIVCLALYYPVCGSDGKTYSNPCNMNTECTGITMANTGVCSSSA